MIYDNICPYTWFLRALSPFTIALWALWTRTQAGSSEIFLGWLHWLIFSWLSLQSHLFEPFLLLSMFQIFLPNSLVLHKLCHLNLTLTICGQSSLQSRIVEFWFKRWRVEQQDALSIFADLTFYRGFHVPDSAPPPPPPRLTCLDQLVTAPALLGFILTLLWNSFYAFWTLLSFINMAHVWMLPITYFHTEHPFVQMLWVLVCMLSFLPQLSGTT